jgi:HAD superfamily hydrolase (TIGR01509 family)
MPVSAVVFDFDGVLANSEPLHLRAYQEVLAPLDLRLDRGEYYSEYLGFDDVGVFRALASARSRPWGDAEIQGLVERKTAIFDRMSGSADVLYPGGAACIERLAADYPLGIASGALRHEISTVLRSAGLDHHIRFIVASGDTLSSKPAPDPYLRAAELHGLPPSACVAIEDSRWGLESARVAGMRTVGITQTYPASELALADVVIDSLDQFTTELIRQL